MAIVNDGFGLRVTLGCSNDKKMNLNYELTAADYDEAVTTTTTILTRIGAVSAGAVQGYSITARAVEDAYSRPTSDDAEYGEKASVTVGILDNPLKSANFVIPMPKIGIFVQPLGVNRDVIDVADTDLIAYKNIFGSDALAYISDGEAAENILSGKRV